ncbi:hypothetical protein BC940DRAFT_21770 [Gongronella butleri]|nr:hypothetical protein BC940DRAFT_21770 [Gongronella butleri]
MLPSNFSRNARPVSEVLKPNNYTSSSEDMLNLLQDDILQYERNLEDMASASFDPTFKDEMHHVDQWFRFLSEAERTATIYTLLQHSTPVQIRFFINLLQQLGKRDSMHSALTTPNPEQGDMQSQFASALAKAEMEASQRLMSVLPYKTGQVVSRPPGASARRAVDRHSFALGDTEDYTRQFLNGTPGSALLGGGGGTGAAAGRPGSQNYSSLLAGTSAFAASNGAAAAAAAAAAVGAGPTGGRPRSVIEGDASTLFASPWASAAASTTSAAAAHAHGANTGPSPRRPMSMVGNIGEGLGLERPKSADVTNWSFAGMDAMLQQQQQQQAGQQQQQQQQRPGSGAFGPSWNFLDDLDFSAMSLHPPHQFRRGAGANGAANSGSAVPSSTTSPTVRSIPGTLLEKDEFIMQAKKPTLLPTSSTSTPYQQQQQQQQQQQRKTFAPPGMEKPAASPHTSPQITNKQDQPNNNEDTAARRVSGSSTGQTVNGSPATAAATLAAAKDKDKKAADVVDMELLKDVPAWFRSLRLHKYNTIFETMKWQDIVKLSDADLEAKGVAALGARRKMLKVFENIKQHCDDNNIDY